MWKNYIKRIRETACWAYTDAQWYWGNKNCLFSLYKYILIEQYALKHFYFSDSFHAFHISSLNLWKSDNLKKKIKLPHTLVHSTHSSSYLCYQCSTISHLPHLEGGTWQSTQTYQGEWVIVVDDIAAFAKTQLLPVRVGSERDKGTRCVVSGAARYIMDLLEQEWPTCVGVAALIKCTNVSVLAGLSAQWGNLTECFWVSWLGFARRGDERAGQT